MADNWDNGDRPQGGGNSYRGQNNNFKRSDNTQYGNQRPSRGGYQDRSGGYQDRSGGGGGGYQNRSGGGGGYQNRSGGYQDRSGGYQDRSGGYQDRGNRRDRNSSRSPSRADDADKTNIYVETSNLGRLIGKGGSKIRELQDQTGARIEIRKEVVNGDSTLVLLSGSTDAQSYAKTKIEELLSDSGYSSRRY